VFHLPCAKRIFALSLLLFILAASLSLKAQVSGPPSTNCHVTDGSFSSCPSNGKEWSDVTPVSFPATKSYLYVNQDSSHLNLYLMYDFPVRTAKLAGSDSVHVNFYTVEQVAGIPNLITYDVYIYGDGQTSILQQGKPAPNGRISAAAGFGLSPNSTTPHVMAELQVPLTVGPPSTYSDDPLYWSAALPTPPPPPDPPSCPVTVLGVCVKSQDQIDAWEQEAEAETEQANADYATGVKACDQLGQDAQASADQLAQEALAQETAVLDGDIAAVSAAYSTLKALAQAGKYAPVVVAAIAQLGNAVSNLATLAPISSPTLYLDVNLAVLEGAANATAAAVAAAEEVALAAAAAPEVLTALGTVALAVNTVSAAELLFAEAVQAVAQAAATDACLAAIELAVAPEYAKAAYYELLAEDPPDPNYTVIATPVVPSLPAITSASGFSPQVVNDFNALVKNSEQEIALLQVIPTSVNRVAGAAAAGSLVWQKQQASAVQQYASELIPLSNKDASLRTALANDLTASGIAFTFTSNNVFNFLGPLQQTGLPSALAANLTKLGVDAATQTSILKAAIASSPISAASLGTGAFPQSLLDPSRLAATNATVSALAELAAVPPTTSLTESFNFTLPGDYTAAGIGLRGQTSGNISLTGIPSGASVVKAYLYFAFLDNGQDASLQQISLNGNAVNGSLIGLGPDTCWGRTNSFTFRAEVTPYVTGNGTYSLTNVASGGNILAEGASLVVVYQLPNSPQKTIIIDDGNLSMPSSTAVGTATFGSFNAKGPVSATTTFIVGDGQGNSFGPTNVSFTGSLGTIGLSNLFDANDGPYWDTDPENVSSVIGTGSGAGSATISITGDCLLWSAQTFSVTSAPVAATPLVATSGVVEAGANGTTVINLRGTGPNDGPTLTEQILAIVQFRIIQNPSLSASTLTTQLVNGLVNDGVISDSQATEIENAVAKAIVIPAPSAPTPTKTTTTVVGQPSGVLFPGEMLTLNITVKPVSGSGIPTGKVTLSSPNSSVTAVVTLDGSGKAVFKTPAPGPGTYTLIGTYSGDSVFAGSVSQPIKGTVSASAVKTTTAISATPSSKIIAGEPLTITVQVKAVTGSSIPNGTVTLMSPNSTATVVLTLDSTGKAIYRTTAPAAGNYSLYAVYNGSSAFSSSISLTLSTTVLQPAKANILNDSISPRTELTEWSPIPILHASFLQEAFSGGGVALR